MKIYGVLFFIACIAGFAGCSGKMFSFTGASIPAEARTVSIPTFPNNALMVTPTLSPTFTEAMQDKFSRQTRLTLVRENGDLNFEGEIIGFTSTPSSISGNEYAQRNRLTISVRVRYTSVYAPQNNFDKTFSAFEDYDSSQLLQDAQNTLIPLIVEKLVDDIFNEALARW